MPYVREIHNEGRYTVLINNRYNGRTARMNCQKASIDAKAWGGLGRSDEPFEITIITSEGFTSCVWLYDNHWCIAVEGTTDPPFQTFKFSSTGLYFDIGIKTNGEIELRSQYGRSFADEKNIYTVRLIPLSC